MKKMSLILSALLITFTLAAQKVEVNTSQSELKWNGKKVTGEHWGYINLKDGYVKLEDNQFVDGEFNIDMNTLNCKDLEDPTWNGKLVGHLKSDDFFSVDKFPLANLKITESTPFSNGEANVKAELTIKGITHPISFKARKTDNGYYALITVDRTKYDVKFRSGKFFENLGDNLIYDDFTLEVNLVL